MTQNPLPGSSTALTMGIISIVGAFICCGPFAIIFSIIALSNAKKAEGLYMANPEIYSGYENVKTARILAYIGLAVALIYLILIILYFGAIIAFIGTDGFGAGLD
ncbi:MAG: CCC motif membrane protein [Bacteroidota bacterium]